MQDHNEVSNQSVKDVLEDIKKVISSGPNNKNPPDEVLNLSNPENAPEVNDTDNNEDKTEHNNTAPSNKQHEILNKIDNTIESTAQPPINTKGSNNSDKNQEQIIKKLPTQQPNTQDQESNTDSNQMPSNEEKKVKNNLQEPKSPATQNSLISKESAISTTSEIKNLIQTIHQNRKDAGLPSEQGITIEELVLNTLKPELSSWLDNHLPRIVKEIVEKEIKNLVKKTLVNNNENLK